MRRSMRVLGSGAMKRWRGAVPRRVLGLSQPLWVGGLAVLLGLPVGAAAQAVAEPKPAPRAAGAPSAAQSPSAAELQLQAVRRALLDKAMAGRTQVSSTSWIDERGELREASEFRSDLQIRGVRVIEYTGEADAPQAVVHAEPVDAANRSGDPQEACPVVELPGAWRHPVGLDLGLLPGQSPLLAGAARQALGLLAHALQRQADLGRGSLAMAGEREPTVFGNPYEQAVHGRAQPRQGLALSVRVRLLEEPELRAAAPVWRRAWAEVRDWVRGVGLEEGFERPAFLAVELSLGRAGEAPRLLLERLVPLTVSGRQSPLHRLVPGASAALAAQAGIAWMAVQDALACEPLSFEARFQGDGRFLLLAGRDAGLEVGDRLVLTDSRHVPRRLLEAGAAPHLAMIEITAVHAGRSEARRIAGPGGSPDPSAQWVAMPFSLQKVPAPTVARSVRAMGEAR